MNLMFLDTAASTTTDMGASMIGLVLPMAILIAMMYFVLYRPQKKQQKKDAEMRNSIEIGDRAHPGDRHPEISGGQGPGYPQPVYH